VVIRWLTAAERAELTMARRQRADRTELLTTYWRWALERAGHREGPLPVPDLPWKAEVRLLRLLRGEDDQEGPGRGPEDS
jgi:hypothetical protein